MNALFSFIASLLGRIQKPTAGLHAPSVNHALRYEAQSLPETLARIAESQVGIEEQGGNNRGPQIQAYQSATNLSGTGWPWCAAFVCWVVWQALQKSGFTPPWLRPRTAGAWNLEAWALTTKGAWSIFRSSPDNPPRRGDICTFVWSHCGIVTGYDPLKKVVYTVEGNAGAAETSDTYADGVRAKKHHVTKLRKLIRFNR